MYTLNVDENLFKCIANNNMFLCLAKKNFSVLTNLNPSVTFYQINILSFGFLELLESESKTLIKHARMRTSPLNRSAEKQ